MVRYEDLKFSKFFVLLIDVMYSVNQQQAMKKNNFLMTNKNLFYLQILIYM